MGTEQDDPFAARRAEMEYLFHSLPAAGTAEYWRRIEHPAVETALPLEVLARCVRERLSTGEQNHAHRIFRVIMGRIQKTIDFWVAARTRALAHWQRSNLAVELEQEYYASIWKELRDTESTWFFEHFTHRLDRVMSHVDHSVLEREGIWKRPDVTTPNRVPLREQDSLEKPIAPGEKVTLSETINDASAASAFEQVEIEADIAALVAALKPDDYLLISSMYWEGLTQKQIAERLGITDRAVRYKLTSILNWMHPRYLHGGEEGYDGK